MTKSKRAKLVQQITDEMITSLGRAFEITQDNIMCKEIIEIQLTACTAMLACLVKATDHMINSEPKLDILQAIFDTTKQILAQT